MLTRIITAVVAIGIAIIVLFLSDTVVFYLAVSAISALIVYELFSAKGLLKYKSSFAVCFLFSALLPFFYIPIYSKYIGIFTYCLAVILFATLIFNHKLLNFNEIFYMICTTLLVSFSLCTLILIKDKTESDGLFYFSIAMASAWIADGGAYFIGTFFGKTKLCPDISPKKTVEGAIGGIVSNVVVLLIVSIVYNRIIMPDRGINYIFIIIYAVVAAIISMIGDLTASLLKRQCNIKDFGKIMPGHGGMLDRFDSVLFVAPLTAILLQFFRFFI